MSPRPHIHFDLLANARDSLRQAVELLALNHTLDSITGTHRRREGQLSSDLAPYHAEVDSLVKNQQSDEGASAGQVGFFKYDRSTEKWRFVRATVTAWRAIGGLGMLGGPFPEIAIESGRWIVNPIAEIAVRSQMFGECRLAIDFRNPFATHLG